MSTEALVAARAPGNLKTAAVIVALVSWILFLGSLWLPAASLEGKSVFGLQFEANEVVLGWEAAWLAVASAEGVLHDRDARLIFVHGVTNLLVIVGPLFVLFGRQGRWRWLAHASLAATLYNLWIGWELDVRVGLGYFLWVASFMAITTALYLKTKSSEGR